MEQIVPSKKIPLKNKIKIIHLGPILLFEQKCVPLEQNCFIRIMEKNVPLELPKERRKRKEKNSKLGLKPTSGLENLLNRTGRARAPVQQVRTHLRG